MKFEYSLTFQDQLHDRFNYLSRRIGKVAANEFLTGFIIDFEKRVNQYPKSIPLCIEAADLGVTTYHDYVDSKLQLRTIYRFSEAEGVVYPLLFLSTRQSIQQALIQYCLRY